MQAVSRWGPDELYPFTVLLGDASAAAVELVPVVRGAPIPTVAGTLSVLRFMTPKPQDLKPLDLTAVLVAIQGGIGGLTAGGGACGSPGGRPARRFCRLQVSLALSVPSLRFKARMCLFLYFISAQLGILLFNKAHK